MGDCNSFKNGHMPPRTRSKLVALDSDASELGCISRIAAPWLQVITSRDPRRVLAMVESDPAISVLVTEQVLSTASGVALLETVRTSRPDVRRVLLTGYGDLATVIAGVHSGAIERLIYKPLVAAELLAAIGIRTLPANVKRASA